MPAGSPRTQSARASKPDRFRSASDVIREVMVYEREVPDDRHLSLFRIDRGRVSSALEAGCTSAGQRLQPPAGAGVRGGRPKTPSRDWFGSLAKPRTIAKGTVAPAPISPPVLYRSPPRYG